MNWLFQRTPNVDGRMQTLSLFGGRITSTRDCPMRYDGEDSCLNYWDISAHPLFTFIHGRGYGYSIWIFLLLITIHRTPFNINFKWNAD